MKEPIGPNVKRLWAAFVAREAIPPGGDLGSGINFLIGLGNGDPQSKAALKRARENVESALDAIKAAPDNPYGDDEEAMAAAIMAKVDERKGKTVRR